MTNEKDGLIRDQDRYSGDVIYEVLTPQLMPLPATAIVTRIMTWAEAREQYPTHVATIEIIERDAKCRRK